MHILFIKDQTIKFNLHNSFSERNSYFNTFQRMDLITCQSPYNFNSVKILQQIAYNLICHREIPLMSRKRCQFPPQGVFLSGISYLLIVVRKREAITSYGEMDTQNILKLLPLNVHPVLNTLNEDIVIRLKSLEAHIVSLRVFESSCVR